MIPEKVNDPELVVEEMGEDSDSQFAMEALIANNKYRVI